MEANTSIIRKIQVNFIINYLGKIESKIIKLGFATGGNFFKTQNPQSSTNQNPFGDMNKLRYMVKQRNLVYYTNTNIENLGSCKIKFYLDDDVK